MFYKIQYENKEDIQRVFEALKQDVNVTLANDTFFIQTVLSKQDVIDKIQISLQEIQFMVLPVTESNLLYQPDIIQRKFRDEKAAIERQRFEDEQQEALKEYNQFIDSIQENLEKQLKESKKGGKSNAKLQQKEPKVTDADTRPV